MNMEQEREREEIERMEQMSFECICDRCFGHGSLRDPVLLRQVKCSRCKGSGTAPIELRDAS